MNFDRIFNYFTAAILQYLDVTLSFVWLCLAYLEKSIYTKGQSGFFIFIIGNNIKIFVTDKQCGVYLYATLKMSKFTVK